VEALPYHVPRRMVVWLENSEVPRRSHSLDVLLPGPSREFHPHVGSFGDFDVRPDARIRVQGATKAGRTAQLRTRWVSSEKWLFCFLSSCLRRVGIVSISCFKPTPLATFATGVHQSAGCATIHTLHLALPSSTAIHLTSCS